VDGLRRECPQPRRVRLPSAASEPPRALIRAAEHPPLLGARRVLHRCRHHRDRQPQHHELLRRGSGMLGCSSPAPPAGDYQSEERPPRQSAVVIRYSLADFAAVPIIEADSSIIAGDLSEIPDIATFGAEVN